MNAPTSPGHRVRCCRCSRFNAVGDRFCMECGTAIAPVPLPTPSPQPAPAGPRPGTTRADSVTRYLCAAAHLDPSFANTIIAEYLTVPTRALPPSPGLDPVAVLCDAVAARKRRRVVDGVLLALVLLLTVISPEMAVLWFALAAVVHVGGGVNRRGVTVLVWVGVGVLGLVLIGPFLSVTAQLALWRLTPQLVSGGAAVGAAGITLGIAFVVFAHAAAVNDLVRTGLSADHWVPDPQRLPRGFTRTLRTAGYMRFGSELRRIAEVNWRVLERDGSAEVVAYRGHHPFIGAGRIVRDESLAIPLQRDEDSDEEPRPFLPSDLYERVDAGICRLRGSSSLAPSHRLRDLTGVELVLVPVEHLLRETTGDLVTRIIPYSHRPPVDRLSRPEIRQLADRPLEVARYVRCYRIEAWERDLTTSTFFHVGTDGAMLFVEWTHCVLFPIAPAYRAIDNPAEASLPVRALHEVVTLPVALLQRLPQLFGSLGPHRSARRMTGAQRYGAGMSIREHASSGQPDTYYQGADAFRYINVLEQAIFSAISSFLTEHHYSVEDVLGAAKARINNSVTFNNSTVMNSAVGNTQVQQSSPQQPKGK